MSGANPLDSPFFADSGVLLYMHRLWHILPVGRVLLICGLFAILLLPVFALAEETTQATGEEPCAPGDEACQAAMEDEDADCLPEVIMHGAGHDDTLMHDRAAAGTVLERNDFDDAGDTAAETIQQQAGARVTRMGGAGSFSTLSLRGSTADQVLVLLDGIALNSAVGGPVDLSRLPVGNIGRIEIYRGTVPIAFGGGGIGGAISVSTRSGHGNKLMLEAGGGSFGSRHARVYWMQKVSDWKVSLGLDYSGWEGNYDFPNDGGTRFDSSDDTVSERSNNDFNQINALTKVQARFGRHWRVSVMDWLLYREQGIAGYGLYPVQDARHAPLDNLTAIKLEGVDLLERIQWDTTASLRIGWSRLSDPLSEVGLRTDDSDDLSLSPQIQSVAKIQAMCWWDITLQAGYSYEHFEPSDAGMTPGASRRHSITAGLESGFSIRAAKLLVLPSVRMEHSRSSMMNRYDTAADTGTSSSTDSAFRLAVVNTSIPFTRLSISGGRSYRQPSLFELFGNTGTVLGNPSLAAETAWNADAGVIVDTADHWWEVSLRAEVYGFYSDVTDLIQFVQTAQNISVAMNIDSARLWGIESGLRLEVWRHLRVSGNYTYLHSENTGEIAARKGRDLPLRPRHSWFVRAEGYDFNMGHGVSFGMYAELEGTGGNYLDNANLVYVDDRLYLGAGLQFDFPHGLSFKSAFRNLTGEQSLDLTGYPLPGRSWMLSLSWKVW